ncbi:chemotaxis protein [uncultured Comamonas sp.]|uniref:chemotaxis protein n=1 Tax=uncultured Comamonas sp. TaxID=114710 RepID=UPI0037480A77
MPLPLIIGAAALAAAAYGGKKGYDGYQKHSEADEIVKNAKDRYARKRAEFDKQESDTQYALKWLGELELQIGKSFGDFKTLADALLSKLNTNRQDKLEIHIPQHKLQKIEGYSYSAIGVLGSMAGAGAAGAAAGFAVYGGVMALGAASTGTAISSLAGVAATNATLAALGGGSLAAGGLGMAGGTAILGAAVAAPVLAIAGWAYDSHGEEALKNARNASDQVTNAVSKLSAAEESLNNTEECARKVRRGLTSIYAQFNGYFDNLKQLNCFIEDLKGRNVDVDAEINKLGDSILQIIENGYALAAILTDVITTPLFKLKEVNGTVVRDENGVPEMAKDSDGSMILNVDAVDKALSQADTDAQKFASV